MKLAALIGAALGLQASYQALFLGIFAGGVILLALFAIGAVSRQELEMLDAEKSREDQRVETARTRLTLLGIPEDKTQRLATPADVVTTFDVRAPMAGVVTARQANQGLNVDPTTPLFTVAT